MSETQGTDLVPVPVEDEPRPWHGATNPFEALYQHFMAEIAKVRAEFGHATDYQEGDAGRVGGMAEPVPDVAPPPVPTD